MSDKTLSSRYDENNITHLKISCFKEFMKRLYFETKYINLTKLCEEYLDELLDNLNCIVKNQQSYIIKISSKENELIAGLNSSLHAISEQSEEESCDNSIVSKINNIQEKLSQIESINENLSDKYVLEINSLKSQIKNLTQEAEQYKRRIIIDSKRSSASHMVLTDNMQNNSHEDKENLNASFGLKEMTFTSPKNCPEDYNALHEKFDTLQKNFNYLQEYLKNLNNEKSAKKKKAESNAEDNLRIEMKFDKEKIHELEFRLQKSEKYLKDREHQIMDLQKTIATMEKQINLTHKDASNLSNQRNAAESRLKVVQQNVNNLQREKEKLANLINKKDMLIAKLEASVEELQQQFNGEKVNSICKLDDINSNLKELTMLLKNKEQEIDLLKVNKTELQTECQKLLKSLLDRDQEIVDFKKRIADYDKKLIAMQERAEKMIRQKMEENFCSVVTYIEEKENEIDQLKSMISQKDLDRTFISVSDSKKINDLETIIMSLTRELREKDEEIRELKKFVDNYKNIYQEIESMNTQDTV